MPSDRKKPPVKRRQVVDRPGKVKAPKTHKKPAKKRGKV
jgi:hypothetical protein